MNWFFSLSYIDKVQVISWVFETIGFSLIVIELFFKSFWERLNNKIPSIARNSLKFTKVLIGRITPFSLSLEDTKILNLSQETINYLLDEHKKETSWEYLWDNVDHTNKVVKNRLVILIWIYSILFFLCSFIFEVQILSFLLAIPLVIFTLGLISLIISWISLKSNGKTLFTIGIILSLLGYLGENIQLFALINASE